MWMIIAVLVIIFILWERKKIRGVQNEQEIYCLRCDSSQVHIKKRGYSFGNFVVSTIFFIFIIAFIWGGIILFMRAEANEFLKRLIISFFEKADGPDVAVFILKAWGTKNPFLTNVEYNLFNIGVTLVVAVLFGSWEGSAGMNKTNIKCLKCGMEWYPGEWIIRFPWYKGRKSGNHKISEKTFSQQSNEPTAVSVSKSVNSTKCIQCGNEIESGEKFCSSCGIEIKREKCKQCGNELKSSEKFCAECGTKITEKMSDGDFIELCQSGTLQEIEKVIKNGANINAGNKYGYTAFMIAARYNPYPDVISILFENGADVNAKDENGKRAIDHASENASLKKTDAYLQLFEASNTGASIAMSDEDFLELCELGTAQEIEAAIKEVDNINVRGEYGETALMVAARFNSNPEAISVLLENDADVNVRDEDGKRAIDYASENENLKGTNAYEELSKASN